MRRNEDQRNNWAIHTVHVTRSPDFSFPCFPFFFPASFTLLSSSFLSSLPPLSLFSSFLAFPFPSLYSFLSPSSDILSPLSQPEEGFPRPGARVQCPLLWSHQGCLWGQAPWVTCWTQPLGLCRGLGLSLGLPFVSLSSYHPPPLPTLRATSGLFGRESRTCDLSSQTSNFQPPTPSPCTGQAEVYSLLLMSITKTNGSQTVKSCPRTPRTVKWGYSFWAQWWQTSFLPSTESREQ